MTKQICFIYTETTGLHKTNEMVSKKYLYNYARMVTLNYMIGHVEDNNFIQSKNIRMIVKPRCMNIPKETEQFHGITQQHALDSGIDPKQVIETFKKDIDNIDIIVGHNIDFHFKTILAEAVRYNINLNLSNYTIIDTISFFHNYGFIKLKDLATNLKVKVLSDTNDMNTVLIKDVFIKLYKKFEKCNI